MESQLLWSPRFPLDTTSPYEKFRKRIGEKYGVHVDTYWDLHKWSVDNYGEFWAELVDFCDIKRSGEWKEVVDKSKRVDEIPKWFPGMRLNYAENLLCRDDEKVAIYYAGEYLEGESKQVTFRQLRQSVQEYAAALKSIGIECGDRIAGYIPNCPETVIIMLASASIGAVWSSASPDFGVEAVVERFEQVQPKVLFSVEGVIYNQKYHDHVEKLREVSNALPSLEKIIVVPHVEARETNGKKYVEKSISLKEFLDGGRLADGSFPSLHFEHVPFDHPLFIMFSSGTTGAPKCMVHSVGGTLLKHLAEHVLQLCLTPADAILFYTTAGWMMWNWLMTALAAGSAIVLYDGSPFLPHPNVLWDLIDRLGITIVGMGAKCFATYEHKKLMPRQTHKLSTLRALLSTGSPLMPHTFEYIYRDIKEDVLVGSISGGTDIIACFVGASVSLSVHSGEIQAPVFGCSVKCYDENGRNVYGDRGELVCTKPFPSMPTHFLNDPDGTKYQRAYFEKYPGVWAHGDYCMINPSTGGISMLGRSDGTLNPGGVRFGSAEIYHVVEKFLEVTDSICVGQKLPDGDERVVLFLKMASGFECDEKLVSRIRQTIRESLSARHVPYAILPIADIPYTSNGKKVEVAVKQVLSGEKVPNRSALANPQVLDLYAGIAELNDTNEPGAMFRRFSTSSCG